MENIVKSVYDIFGPECPSRSFYSSCAHKPFPALTITKAYRTWSKFEIEYKALAIAERNKKAANKVVTKDVKSKK